MPQMRDKSVIVVVVNLYLTRVIPSEYLKVYLLSHFSRRIVRQMWFKYAIILYKGTLKQDKYEER